MGVASPQPSSSTRRDKPTSDAPFIMDIIEMHKLPGEFDHFYTYNKFAANCVHVQTCKFCCKLAILKIVQIPIHIYYLIIGLFITLHVSSIVSIITCIYCTCCIYCTYYMYILFLCIITGDRNFGRLELEATSQNMRIRGDLPILRDKLGQVLAE